MYCCSNVCMLLQYRSVHSRVYNIQFLVDNNDTGPRYCITGGLALLCKTPLLFLSLILWWQHSSRSIGLFSHSTVSFYFVVYARHLLCSYYVRQCQNSGSCTLGWVCQPLCIQLCALSLSLDTIEAFDVSAHACVYVFNDNSVLLGFACFQSDSPCFWMFGVILPMACA